MKQVKDIVKRFAILDESSLSDWKGSRSMQMYPMVRADGTPVKETQRKNRLEFRRQPKHATAAGAMAALSHALAQRNSHWAYADEIAAGGSAKPK